MQSTYLNSVTCVPKRDGYVTAQIQAITVLSRIQLQFLRSKLRLSGAVTSDGMIIGRVNKAIDWYCHSALRHAAV